MSEHPAESPDVERSRARRAAAVGLSLALVLGAVIGGVLLSQTRAADDAASARAQRQAVIEDRGATVMPFDQDRTTHRFTDTATGGVQTVTVNSEVADDRQVALIREHLATERTRFANGDFSDPMAIHGPEMPGLDALEAGARSGVITVVYEEVPGGASLTYSTTDPSLVDALHTWFDAQLADHGPHATS